LHEGFGRVLHCAIASPSTRTESTRESMISRRFSAV
jgi:hypothetical protein